MNKEKIDEIIEQDGGCRGIECEDCPVRVDCDYHWRIEGFGFTAMHWNVSSNPLFKTYLLKCAKKLKADNE